MRRDAAHGPIPSFCADGRAAVQTNDYIPATADDTIYFTDNPMSHIGSFAMLEPGETFYILSYYNYYAKNGLDWWYIECEVDGQAARGFIDRSLSAFHLGSAVE